MQQVTLFQFSGPVAGVDEAGRGPLAGPVVAAAVEALGWTGKKGIEADVARMLHHKSEWVQAAALRATADNHGMRFL